MSVTLTLVPAGAEIDDESFDDELFDDIEDFDHKAIVEAFVVEDLASPNAVADQAAVGEALVATVVVPIVPEIPAGHWSDLYRLVISSLARRGFPDADVHDVAQNMAFRIARKPATYAEKLAALAQNQGYFLKMAYHTYLMLLRSEQSRRDREQRWCEQAERQRVVTSEVADALELAQEAPLTDRQRDYFREVLVNHRSIAEIAAIYGTTDRAVRAVLQRAGSTVGEYYRSAA